MADPTRLFDEDRRLNIRYSRRCLWLCIPVPHVNHICQKVLSYMLAGVWSRFDLYARFISLFSTSQRLQRCFKILISLRYRTTLSKLLAPWSGSLLPTTRTVSAVALHQSFSTSRTLPPKLPRNWTEHWLMDGRWRYKILNYTKWIHMLIWFRLRLLSMQPMHPKLPLPSLWASVSRKYTTILGFGKRFSHSNSQPKAQPKPATATKNATTTGRRGRARARKPKGPAQHKKTAEELDAEMEDYFVGSENAPSGAATTNGAAAAAAAAGDETMAEISVSIELQLHVCYILTFLIVNTSIPGHCAILARVLPTFLYNLTDV